MYAPCETKDKKVHFESKTKKGKNPVGIYSSETNEKKRNKKNVIVM